MKNILLTALILLISAISLVAQSNKDTAAIRKIMDDQDAAWNRGDLEAFMSIGYWKSDKLKFVSGDKITYGWQQTLDNYKKTYGTPDKMGKLTFSNLEIELLSKDAAFVTGSWHLKREKDAPQGKFTLLFRKLKEGWRIVVDHSS
ncbi:MAG: nuclear transport factor 2 family protein [Acidobacteria bacterium]|nr:nuclear transport factor 2 family protein [Acidobacteriota bacterium]